MNNSDLQAALSNAVNYINQLLSQTKDPTLSQNLHCLREFFFDLWEAALRKSLDNTTPLYLNTIAALKTSQASAAAAQADLNQISSAINDAATAAKVADQLINVGLQVAKFFP